MAYSVPADRWALKVLTPIPNDERLSEGKEVRLIGSMLSPATLEQLGDPPDKRRMRLISRVLLQKPADPRVLPVLYPMDFWSISLSIGCGPDIMLI
jgi:hypothetical protein